FNFPNTGQIYDPAANTWTDTGRYDIGRTGASLTMDSSGEPMLIGGSGFTGGALSTIQLYDPRTDRWYDDGDLSTPRQQGMATLLPNGRVVLAGGAGGSLLAGTELSPALVGVTVTNNVFTPSSIRPRRPGLEVRWLVQ